MWVGAIQRKTGFCIALVLVPSTVQCFASRRFGRRYIIREWGEKVEDNPGLTLDRLFS